MVETIDTQTTVLIAGSHRLNRWLIESNLRVSSATIRVLYKTFIINKSNL